jgi:hypothetical protein
LFEIETNNNRGVLPSDNARIPSDMKLLNVPIVRSFTVDHARLADEIARFVLPGAKRTGTEGREGNEGPLDGEEGQGRGRPEAVANFYSPKSSITVNDGSLVPLF